MLLAVMYPLVGLQLAVSVAASAIPRSSSSSTSVKFQGQTFVNQGLVGLGIIPANATDSKGDTIGGVGSAIAFKRGTWKLNADGTYTGTLIVQPDRGYNVETTVDYQGRQHAYSVVLTPYTNSKKLSYNDAKKTLQLTYQNTIFYTERSNTATSGLDATGIRAQGTSYPSLLSADPQLPIASASYDHMSLDAEGLAIAPDGTFYTSDEYGPYIYKFSATGSLISVIQPPQAILPFTKKALLDFSSDDDPATGRAANHGFEGLTLNTAGTTLYALLQSALIQDGGGDSTTSRYTRLLAYDVSSSQRGTLIGEWIVPLPQSKKDNTREVNELHYLNDKQFLVLARDGNGHGGDTTDASYKNADLIDISGATDIHGTAYDSTTAVAPKGKLAKGVTAAAYSAFVDYTDDDQLARFGMHNEDPDDQTLIGAKFESLALAPALDSANPDDYFLFTAQDNDFITLHGSVNGQSYKASYGQDVDSQFLVYRLTLPSVVRGSVQSSLGL